VVFLILIGILVGALLLGLRFTVFVLVPVICIALATTAVGGVVRGDDLWQLAISMIMIATAVQVGYILGVIIRFVTGWARSTYHSTVSLPRLPGISGSV
jgi:hypothetical protein